MAGVTIVPVALQRGLLSAHTLRAARELPRLRQSLPLASSRASWSLAWKVVVRPGAVGLRYKEAIIRRGEGIGRLGDRRGLKDDRKDGKSPTTLPPQSPTLASTLTTTLKSALPTSRHEQIWNIPNLLTFSRLFATPILGYLILQNHHLYAFTLFLYAGFSDLLDGWIARKWNLQTVVGSVVDPMADKALMTTLVCCLAANGTLPLPLATLILGRDVSLAIAAIYFRYASLPAPKTMRRYWDFSLPSAEVHPTTISKLNTFLQLGLIGSTMCVGLLSDPAAINSAFGSSLLGVQSLLGGPDGVATLMRGMQGVVATTTVYSGLSYVWTKEAVKILGDDEGLKRRQGFRGRMIIGVSYGAFIVGAGWLAWRNWNKEEEEVVTEDE
ncbi:cardiolipin synthetase [Dendryphion nanum]|uniref:Cardiolipin synthetase n=1 Tax=Dendryphion nanum TaxID=256645 RepID=A0A9P9DNF8_9PLEO|nr:cardiolipin synthetase [Dendryphion nanum]